MTSGVPWQLIGVRQQTLDAARETARRSGLSLEEWLDSAINRSDSAGTADAPPLQTGPGQDGLSDIKNHLGSLGRQLDRLTRASANQVRALAQDMAPAPAADPPTSLDQALMEIAARQRVLDGVPQRDESSRDETRQDEKRAPELPRAPTQGFAALERQLRDVSSRIDTLRPCGIDAALETLRDDLAEIGVMLKEAMPREAIEALEAEVRGLAERIAGTPHGGTDETALSGLEQGLAEVRDALRALTPAEHLIGVDGVLAELSRKIDQVAGGGRDPAGLAPLESAVAELRKIVPHVASNDALTALADEVHALAAKVNQATGISGADLSALEQRIATLTDALQSRNEHPLVPSDSPLDERIMRLIEKLEASEARLGTLDTIEQTLTSLVEHLEGERAAAAGTSEAGSRAAPAEADATIVAASLLRAMTPAIAAPVAMPPEEAATAATATPAPATAALSPPSGPLAQERRPIDPNLPPDHPIEPGSVNRGRVASPAERIAASEAAIRAIKPPVIPDPAERPNFIAAARRAAQAANAAARGDGRSAGTGEQAQGKAAGGWGSRVRSLLVGTSVLLIVLGSVHLVSNLLSASREPAKVQAPDMPAAQQVEPAEPVEPPLSVPPTAPEPAPAAAPSGRQSTLIPSAERTPFPPAPAATPPAAAAAPDITNTITNPPPRQMEAAAPARPGSAADALPVQIGGKTLRTAAGKGDAAAQFEIALRYAEGHGVPQDLAKAAEWFKRAADQGLAPAQFRLGGLYEKGMGVARNLDTARGLYLAAAEAGNAKAMHNLAVIYAEGIAGKPDYPTAAKWFAKAADCGVIDSQFNLAILYARGIGVQPNLAEAYKWFALAARDGDKESARKRDDVGGRLDQQTLAAAQLAVQNWAAQPQPDAAVQVKAPPGGWDDAAPAAAPAKRQSAASKLGLNLPAPLPTRSTR
jgi:localization factor PodJL